MSSHKSLSLPHRLESPHPSLPYSDRLVGLLCPVIFILLVLWIVSGINSRWATP